MQITQCTVSSQDSIISSLNPGPHGLNCESFNSQAGEGQGSQGHLLARAQSARPRPCARPRSSPARRSRSASCPRGRASRRRPHVTSPSHVRARSGRNQSLGETVHHVPCPDGAVFAAASPATLHHVPGPGSAACCKQANLHSVLKPGHAPFRPSKSVVSAQTKQNCIQHAD